MTRWRPPSDARARGAGSSGRPVKRRTAYHGPRWRRRLRLAVLLASSAAFATVLAVAGLTFSAPLSVTPTPSTTTPSPAPFTAVSPQAADASPFTTRPTGVAPLGAQSTDTTPTTATLTGGPTITPQTSNGTPVTTQPSGAASANFRARDTTHFRPTDPLDQEISGTAPVQPQVGDTPAGFDPTGSLPSGSQQTGTFTVDVDGDGNLGTVHFVLTDSGGVVSVDLSAGDTVFGEGTLNNQVVKAGDDERIEATGTAGSGEVWFGDSSTGLRFRVEFSATEASITALSRFFRQVTDNDKIDLDADGNADDDFYVVLSDTNSNGLYDTADVSIGNTVFGEGGGSDGVPDGLQDGVVDFGETDNTNDERFGTTSAETGSQGADIKLGAYTFTLRFDNNPRNDSSDFRFRDTTWFTGELTADLNADGDLDEDEHIVAYVLSDTDSDGLYDTLDLSTDDGPLSSTTFGENGGGPLTNGVTGTDDDERITATTNVRLGPPPWTWTTTTPTKRSTSCRWTRTRTVCTRPSSWTPTTTGATPAPRSSRPVARRSPSATARRRLRSP